MANETPRLEDFTYLPRNVGRIIQTPAFPTGDFGKAFYDLMKRDAQENFAGNDYINRLQMNKAGEVTGSNLFVVAQAGQLLAPMNVGIQPVSLKGLHDKELLTMIEGKHYVDVPAVVLRSTDDSVEAMNNPLARYMAEYIEGFSAEKPALIRGFGVEQWPEDEKGYQLKLVPLNGKNFEVLLDDRFSAQYNGWKFTQVDNLGIPTDLTHPSNFTQEKGRTWYTRDDGLSGVCGGRVLDVDSGVGLLAGSTPHGRVAFESAQRARAQNFSDILANAQRKELAERLRNTKEYLSDLEQQIINEGQ